MHKLAKLLSILFILAVGFFLASIANAENAFSWINSPLSFQKGPDTSATPSSLNNNINCQKQDANSCSIPTSYGSAQNGTVRLNSSADYRPVISYIDNKQHFLAIPNSNTFITYTTEPPYGFYLYFNYNFTSSIAKVPVFGGGIQYKVNRAPDGRLVDKSNKRLAADYTSINFSTNGQWMVVSMPNVAMLRVNLQTFEVIPFAGGFNYTIGIDPAIRTAISNDGRYAVVSSKGFNNFKIYDLSTCGAVPDIINGPVSCQSRDIKSFLNQQLLGYSFSSNVKFISNNALTAYATYFVGSTRKTAMVTIGTSESIFNQIQLLAMGESYISGEGAFNYQGGTDTSDNKCHLSLISYPNLMGHDLNYNSYHSIACSGALTKDIIDTTDFYTGQAQNRSVQRKQRTQIEIDSIFASFKPGYINQSDFVARYQPQTILLSIGGNDIGFSKIVTKCGVPWELVTCYSSYEDRVELVREINNHLYPKLVQTYQIIKNSGAPNAQVYIVGYPQIAKPDGNCALNVHLRKKEIEFSKQLISYLNSVIKIAASKAGVFYVDAEDALVGHRLCEAKGGSVAVNGLTLGFDLPTKFGPIGTESYHPNDLGHQLLENKILSATQNLTESMPAANLSVGLPSENGLDILNVPHSSRTIYNTRHDDSISDNTIFRGSPLNISVNGAQHSLKPSGQYLIELHSTPTSLGIYSSDSNGNLDMQAQIPADIPTGSHTLYIYGESLAGDSINIYKTIYVAASGDDYNGNGVPNSSDPCVFVDASGQDYDQDGIDDACDGVIDEAPPPAAAPVTPPASGGVGSGNNNPSQTPNNNDPTSSPANDTLKEIFTNPSLNPVVTSQTSSSPTITASSNNTVLTVENNDVTPEIQKEPIDQPRPAVLAAQTTKSGRNDLGLIGALVITLGTLGLMFGIRKK